MMLRARARAESTARDERGSCGGDDEDDGARERREHLFQPQLLNYRVSKAQKMLSEINHRG